MLQSVLNLSYLAGSLTFILGLKMLSNPATARKGNWLAAAGMAVAIAGTIFLYKDDNGSALGNYGWIFGGLIIGIGFRAEARASSIEGAIAAALASAPRGEVAAIATPYRPARP